MMMYQEKSCVRIAAWLKNKESVGSIVTVELSNRFLSCISRSAKVVESSGNKLVGCCNKCGLKQK